MIRKKEMKIEQIFGGGYSQSELEEASGNRGFVCVSYKIHFY